MSQFGMQMPGGRKRSASPDVYTGLMVIACVFLGAAVFVVYTAGGKVGPDGNAFALQDKDPKSLKLADVAKSTAAPAPAPRAAAPAGGAKSGS